MRTLIQISLAWASRARFFASYFDVSHYFSPLFGRCKKISTIQHGSFGNRSELFWPELSFHEEPEAFRISYEATVREKEQEFRYSARIAGKSDGSLRFSGKGTATSDFLTNRAGFVVLHPIEGVAGAACTVEHVDGTIEETRFPFLIDPVQPISALRTITDEFLPGLKVSCRMEGDTFEMEDQRSPLKMIGTSRFGSPISPAKRRPCSWRRN